MYMEDYMKRYLEWLNSDKVDEETKKARLAIVDATTKVIKTALGLLGIETVESM